MYLTAPLVATVFFLILIWDIVAFVLYFKDALKYILFHRGLPATS